MVPFFMPRGSKVNMGVSRESEKDRAVVARIGCNAPVTLVIARFGSGCDIP